MQTLEFEKGIVELESSIRLLREESSSASTKDIFESISKQQKELDKMLAAIYSKLDSWQTCQVARHFDRPHTADYIRLVFTEFNELHGDRMYADDKAIIGGLARLNGQPVMVIGHEKGRETSDKVERNWGMPHPEGYRKALRLMRLAESFAIPIITLIDTPGAFCGIGAEERGMAQAIGANLVAMATLRTPILCVVIGEGGSGGALAIGVGDRMLMLEHAVYSVITPEGCAAILWRSAEGNLAKAANAMRMRARDLLKIGLIDGIIPEPNGGAHRDHDKAASLLAAHASQELEKLTSLPLEECLNQRARRLREYGKFREGRY